MASGLTNADVEKQIKHMMAFIDQEANEKVEEIDAKAEEEFNIEKGRLVQQQRVKIMEYYDKKEKQIELQKKIQNSNLLNAARLKVLQSRETHVNDLLEDASSQLGQITQQPQEYAALLNRLICQGAMHLIEKELVVRCREADVFLVRQVLPDACKFYKSKVGRDCKFVVDDKQYLPADCAGGVELRVPGGQILVENTLEKRLGLISEQMVPELRELLFGVNPNRKFTD